MAVFTVKNENVQGKAVALDDLILTKDYPTAAGSKMLEGFMSLFDAEVVPRLQNAGYGIAGKVNVGEFSLDVLGETSHFGANRDQNGNLVSALSESIKTENAFACLCTDSNGTPRRAAALSDLCYIKPTYATVSRYGLVACVCSGETVGVMAKTADDCAEILSVIAGHDDKDGTSLPQDMIDSAKNAAPICKVAVISSFMNGLSADMSEKVNESLTLLRANGIEIEVIDDSILPLAQPAWNTLSAAELCNNISRFDGVKYGYRTANYKNIEELYTNSRTEAFGLLTKMQLLYGSEVLSTENYMPVYDKALRMRRVLCAHFNELFASYDAIVLPACSQAAYSDTVADTAYNESLYTAPASICGLPVAAFGGIQVIGKAFSDHALLALAKKTEGGAAQ